MAAGEDSSSTIAATTTWADLREAGGGTVGRSPGLSLAGYASRRGELYALCRDGGICVVDVKGVRRNAKARAGGNGGVGSARDRIDMSGARVYAPPPGALPSGFVGCAIEVNPVSSPYEQAVAVCGVVPSRDGGAPSTFLFKASISPLQGNRAAKAQYGGVRVLGGRDVGRLAVLRFRWHPRSPRHLIALLRDAVTRESHVHVYDVSRPHDEREGGMACGMAPEQAYVLSAGPPLGFGAAKVPKAHRFVDFCFGPMDAWAAFALLLVTSAGRVYALCPLAPMGALYPSHHVRRMAVHAARDEREREREREGEGEREGDRGGREKERKGQRERENAREEERQRE